LAAFFKPPEEVYAVQLVLLLSTYAELDLIIMQYIKLITVDYLVAVGNYK